jgi:very-short-patch-repair endonuclease
MERHLQNRRPSPSKRSVERARKLRRDSTVPERILWGLIRGGRLGGLKFRRQHPIGPFFADYCHERKLVIELDGMSQDGRADADRRRESYLRQSGFAVLRVGNDDVLRDLETVAIAILRAAGRPVESGTRPDLK